MVLLHIAVYLSQNGALNVPSFSLIKDKVVLYYFSDYPAHETF